MSGGEERPRDGARSGGHGDGWHGSGWHRSDGHGDDGRRDDRRSGGGYVVPVDPAEAEQCDACQ